MPVTIEDTTERDDRAATAPEAEAAAPQGGPEPDAESDEPVADLLVEDVSIDGMCGVY